MFTCGLLDGEPAPQRFMHSWDKLTQTSYGLLLPSTSRRSLQMATEDVSKVRLWLQIQPFTSTCLGDVKQKQKWQACFEEICFFSRARQTTPFRPLNFKECRYNIANFLDLSPPRNWKMFKNSARRNAVQLGVRQSDTFQTSSIRLPMKIFASRS